MLLLPWLFDGRSYGTDLPLVLVSGFACLNLALLAIAPLTGCVCIKPRKFYLFAPLAAFGLTAAWAAAVELPFLTMKSELSLWPPILFIGVKLLCCPCAAAPASPGTF